MPKGPHFDLTVHHRSPKDGHITRVTPYKMVVEKGVGKYFVRGGKKYWENGEEIPEDWFKKARKENGPELEVNKGQIGVQTREQTARVSAEKQKRVVVEGEKSDEVVSYKKGGVLEQVLGK